jgi:O-antigen/teichoic acid export membrane protein
MLRLTVHSLTLRARKSKIASSTGIITVGMSLRLILQMACFLLVTRYMGAGEFGAFVSVAASVAIISAFSGWGAEQLLIRAVAHSPSAFGRAFGSATAFLALSAPPLVATAYVIIPIFTAATISRQLIIYVAIADIVFARINNITAGCYLAVNQPVGNVRQNLGFSGARLTGALLWIALSTKHDAQSWAAYYCGVSGLYAAVSVWQICRDLGLPVWNIAWREWREGLHFSLQAASFLAFGNIDKPVVALLSDLSTAGRYAAGFRIVEAAVVPVRALVYSTYARFFQLGAGGVHESLKFAIRLLPVAVGLALIGSFGVVMIARVAPHLLGAGYAGTETIIYILAALPVLYAFYYLAADVLVSSNYTGLRTLLQCLMPFLSITLCVVLVPVHGAVGAAIAASLSYSTMAVAAWILALVLAARARRLATPALELPGEPRVGGAGQG